MAENYYYPNVTPEYPEDYDEKKDLGEMVQFNEDEMGVIRFCLGHYAESGMKELEGYQLKDLKEVEALYKKVFGRDMLDLEKIHWKG